MSTTKNTTPKTTTAAANAKDEPKKEIKSFIIGGFWNRESTINPGQKYLAGMIRLNGLTDTLLNDGPSLRVSAYKARTKKSDKSFDITLFANKDDLRNFYQELKSLFDVVEDTNNKPNNTADTPTAPDAGVTSPTEEEPEGLL